MSGQPLGEVMAPQFVRHFGVDEHQGIVPPLIHEERDVAIGGQLETAGFAVVHDVGILWVEVGMNPGFGA